jgi:hypothetical protein
MKHIIMGLFILLFLTSPASRTLATENPAGKIHRLEGSVVIDRQGKIIQGLVNTTVYSSDEIKTGPESLVELILQDGSSLHMGPDSNLDLILYKFSLMEDNPSFMARMAKGIFVYISGAISKLHPGSVRFETPDGTVAIRGTKLVLNIIEPAANPGIAGKTTLVLLKDPNGNVGQVGFSNDHGQTRLDQENFSVTANRGKAPPSQVFMNRESMEQMVPQILVPVVFENYTPPLPYTEAVESLMDQGAIFVPQPVNPYSESIPSTP